ncbi:MAG TPA: putative 2OG-Fe(II) oxygenase [Pirellulales bacterium]|nr:putative 2OG-Fe(II) oxygenase [Pirellulales bacterium]
MPTEVHIGDIFPTRLVTTTLTDVNNEQLVKIVYALHEAGCNITGPRVQSEQTQGNLLAIEHPAIVALRRAFVQIISAVTRGEDYVLQVYGWANIVRRSDHEQDPGHNHLPFHWSAVYYPQVPSLRGTEGNLVFYDSKDVYTPSAPVTIAPKTGLFIMFPSWLRHKVLPLKDATEDRISIALNAVCGLSPTAPVMALPHRLKKRAPGDDQPQELDPSAAPDFPYADLI